MTALDVSIYHPHVDLWEEFILVLLPEVTVLSYWLLTQPSLTRVATIFWVCFEASASFLLALCSPTRHTYLLLFPEIFVCFLWSRIPSSLIRMAMVLYAVA